MAYHREDESFFSTASCIPSVSLINLYTRGLGTPSGPIPVFGGSRKREERKREREREIKESR